VKLKQVDKISGIQSEDFLKNYLKPGFPVIISILSVQKVQRGRNGVMITLRKSQEI
jgi:hypothetical protein